ncbi:MAG: OmpA family protein [Bacteroidales bacterium]|nr:OmpA family protein [Bacteroidales bacterium]
MNRIFPVTFPRGIRIVLCLFFAGISMAGNGQYYVNTGANLVPNPGFEDTRACPKDCDYIGGVVSWNLFPNFSADYFHRCANVYQSIEYRRRFPREEILNFSVPRSMFGYQEAHSGDAYAGISFCNEALAVKLLRPLVKDSVYKVEFFVSLADSSNVGTRYFGMYLSETSIRAMTDNRMLISSFILETPPQIQNPPDRFLTDTANWTPITGFYTAKGGEQYIAISGFYAYHDSLVQRIRPDRPLAKVYRSMEKQLGYYFVDDVSVAPYSKEWAPELGVTYVLQYIYFDFDKSDLLPESADELDRLSAYLEKHPDCDIAITGHTDNFGTEAYNLNLSNNRAKAVASYLLETRIDQQRITYSGAGSSEPIADNSTAHGRSLNRRVEFTLQERPAKTE